MAAWSGMCPRKSSRWGGRFSTAERVSTDWPRSGYKKRASARHTPSMWPGSSAQSWRMRRRVAFTEHRSEAGPGPDASAHEALDLPKSNAGNKLHASASRVASGAKPHRHSMNLRIEVWSYGVESMYPWRAQGETMMVGTRPPGPQRSMGGGATWSYQPPKSS